MSKNTLEVWPQKISEAGSAVVVSAKVEGPGVSQELWYRFPADRRGMLCDDADGFTMALLHLAMRLRVPLVIHGAVSRSLLANTDRWQSVWTCWRPDLYGRVEIRPQKVIEPARAATPAGIAAFSGGVDSTYTVWRHHRKLGTEWDIPLKAGMLVHGFDIPLDQEASFRIATTKAAEMLADIGMDLIPVATNFRSFEMDWEQCFAAATTSAMAFLKPAFTAGYIGSAGSYSSIRIPWGSTPIHDHLLSSDALHIIHDGADQERIGKVAAISQWPAAMRLLRVCWEGPDPAKNCCQCEKCIRTMLEFRAVLGHYPEAFEQPVSEEQIRNLRVKGIVKRSYLELALDYAREHGNAGSWVDALDHALRESRNAEHPTRWSRLRERIAIRTRLKQAIGIPPIVAPPPLFGDNEKPSSPTESMRTILPERTASN